VKPFYFLHIPRSGGTSIVQNLIAHYGNCPYRHSNGNPIDAAGNWLPFWNWDISAQRQTCGTAPFICSERRIGSAFDPTIFTYVTCIRDPIEQRLSLMAYRLSSVHNITTTAGFSQADWERTFHESLQLFPANQITWMLSASTDSEQSAEEHLALASSRLAQMQAMTLPRIAADFESVFSIPYDRNKGRHASTLTITPNDLPASSKAALRQATELDYRLLNGIPGLAAAP